MKGGMSRGGGPESWRGAWCCPAHGRCSRDVGLTEAQLGTMPAFGTTMAAAGALPALGTTVAAAGTLPALGATVAAAGARTCAARQPNGVMVKLLLCAPSKLGHPRLMGSCRRPPPCMTWAA